MNKKFLITVTALLLTLSSQAQVGKLFDADIQFTHLCLQSQSE